MTLTLLQINVSDLDVIRADLAEKLQQSPGGFESLPVLLSLPGEAPDVAALIGMLRKHALVPVALLDPTREQARVGREAGVGVLPDTKGKTVDTHSRDKQGEAEPARQSSPSSQPQPGYRLVTTPVRSGQQIYARGGDLIVTASVSEGAEVIADGHVHVYGALRGRAIAGAGGDTQARIFCRHFAAELVAVAGHYKVADDIDTQMQKQAVQIRLAGDQLLIDKQE